MQCRLSFILDKCIDEPDRSLPSSHGARYAGTAFHGVVDAARKGEAGDPPDPDRLASIWSERIRELELRAGANGDDDWLPLMESVVSLERIRLSAIRLGAAQRVRPLTSGGGTGGSSRGAISND